MFILFIDIYKTSMQAVFQHKYVFVWLFVYHLEERTQVLHTYSIPSTCHAIGSKQADFHFFIRAAAVAGQQRPRM